MSPEFPQPMKTIIEAFRQAAIRTGVQDPATFNRWAARVRACYKLLRRTKEGREAIISLVGDPNVHVRFWAASYALQWVPGIARAALEKIRDSEGWDLSFTAEITLKEFDKGTLSFDC